LTLIRTRNYITNSQWGGFLSAHKKELSYRRSGAKRKRLYGPSFFRLP